MSLLSTILVVGSWWTFKHFSPKHKLQHSVREVTNYLNQVHAASVYAGVDVCVRAKKNEPYGFVFYTHFSRPLPKSLHVKRKFFVKHLDILQCNASLNEEVRIFFDGFLGTTQEHVLSLSFKGQKSEIQLEKFPLPRDFCS